MTGSRWWRRLCRVVVVGSALAVCPLVIAQQTQIAEARVSRVLPPGIPIAPSILGGAGAATGGTVAGSVGTTTVAAGAFTAASTTLLATAAFFGSYYGTTALLHWAFDNPEAATPQPVLSDWPPVTLPSRRIMSCTNSGWPLGAEDTVPVNMSGFVAPKWTYPASVAGTCNEAPPNTASATVQITTPAWRCANGASSCQPLQIGYLSYNATTGDKGYAGGVICSGFSGSSGPAGTHTCSFTTPPTSAGYVRAGLFAYGDPAVVEWEPAPLHKWRIITTCKHKVSGAQTTGTNYSAQFTEADTVPAQIQVPQCSAGYSPIKIEIWEGDPTGAGGILRYSWNAPADVSVTTPTSPYKSCYPGGSEAPCILELWKVAAGEQLLSCKLATVDCTTFDVPTSTTQTYRCLWGSHSMPLSDCEALEEWAKTQTQVEPTTQPTTTTGTGTQPTITVNVSPYPTAGTNIDPRTGLPRTGTDVPTDPTDEDGGNCMGSVWSWNPVNWVLVPVKCALKWAFVPKQATMTGYGTRLKTAFGDSAPGKWVGAIEDVKTGFGSQTEAGCMGPRIAWDKLPGGEMYPFKACEGVMATAASVTKLLATIAVTFFGGLACLRALGAGMGWNPGVGGKGT